MCSVWEREHRGTYPIPLKVNTYLFKEYRETERGGGRKYRGQGEGKRDEI